MGIGLTTCFKMFKRRKDWESSMPPWMQEALALCWMVLGWGVSQTHVPSVSWALGSARWPGLPRLPSSNSSVAVEGKHVARSGPGGLFCLLRGEE